MTDNYVVARVFEALSTQAWERARGELLAMISTLDTYSGDCDAEQQYEESKRIMDKTRELIKTLDEHFE